ncbi:hypothetical protein CYMTET_39331 [Cymbomonas tetramitiformis]|uniref:Uncharacterized protein n=1 Tax=Cymbomonas tetramitiformis TaxID=36881 RepID=A0AAE0CA94_9CHLO|nr:hypothetical protein CYMTET_39331 [Cymbomonas tetramitiformis]
MSFVNEVLLEECTSVVFSLATTAFALETLNLLANGGKLLVQTLHKAQQRGFPAVVFLSVIISVATGVLAGMG